MRVWNDPGMNTRTGQIDEAQRGEAASRGGAEPRVDGLSGLLSVQRRVGRAKAAAVLEDSGDGDFAVVASGPQGRPAGDTEPGSEWLDRAKREASAVQALGPSRVVPLSKGGAKLYGQSMGLQVVLMAAGQSAGGAKRVEAFLVDPLDERDLRQRVELLELSRTLLDLNQARAAATREAAKSRRLAGVLETLDATQSVAGFRGTAMAWCNELCARFGAERVSVGFVSGRYVKLAATSQTEHLNRRMQLVQDIAAAMEESLDQDATVVYPSEPTTPLVSRSAGELSRRHGSERDAVVATLPLRDREGEPVGAVTLERPASSPVGEDELASLRLLCDLATPRLLELKHSDRWFGARWAGAARRQAATVLSPEHTWAKVAGIVALGLICFAFLGKGTDWVESSFVVEPVVARSVPAPWNGYLEAVHVEPGDRVTGGETVLGRLDTAELRLELAEARADAARFRTEADMAWREGDQARREIAKAQARQAEARVALHEYRIAQASILAPVTGVVTQGDLKKELGRPVEKGQALFEVAPLESLRAVMHVPEHRIADVHEGQTGELATAFAPGVKLPFVVEHVYPVAEVVDQRNVFKVRIRLDHDRAAAADSAQPSDRRAVDWLQPGVEGVAKADAGVAPYAWLWTRRAINWVRMQLWL